MSLDEIQNELYKKEPNKELLQHEKSEFDASSIVFTSPEKSGLPKDEWLEKEDVIEKEDKKIVKKGALIVGGLFLVIAVVVGFYKIKQSFFDVDRLSVSLEGPSEVKSGNLITYEIKYKNDNRADLKNVTLRMSYPEDFKPEGNADFKSEGTMVSVLEFTDIKGQSEGKIVFNGRTYSPRGNLIKIKAEISYIPSTVSTTFVAGDQLSIGVISTPITLEVTAPQNISSNDEVNYLVNYKNEGAENFENIRIKIDYPEQFTFTSSDPKVFEGNNIWYVGSLAGGQSGKIVVAGKMSGNRDEVKLAKVTIGANSNGGFVSYNEESVRTKIISSPLVITQTVNGLDNLTANAGDNLRFKIDYKNEGPLGLRDVIVTEHIDSTVLDYSTLDTDGGAYDANSKTITWKASDHKELKNLASGQGGTISFIINIKGVIPVASGNDKNFVISSLAKIDSPDIPTPISMNKVISGNKMDIKLNSKLVLDVKGYYNDAKIPNTGPVPPKVSQESTYTMHFIASNVSNDIESAKVEAVLPTSVSVTGKFFPEGSPIFYNERTNSIIWNIGNLEAGAGIVSPGKEVAFQVKIKPSVDQVGQEAPLLNESVFSAKDLFTGENISAKVPGKSTRLYEDDGLVGSYKVSN
ncbi:MAG: hypothetical protein WAV73_03435 [Candidatus Moraniibacteriota bacterium]